jgi:hypothetical protein
MSRFLTVLLFLVIIVFLAVVFSMTSERFERIDRDCLILQTSDGKSSYHEMVEILRPVQEEYARRHGWSYLYAPGILYGAWPNHSIFNRYFLLRDVRRNHPGVRWVLYMDADSYFVDMDKDWKSELDPAFLVIACAGSAETKEPWDFNNGVFFFHARHPMAKKFLDDYVRELRRRYPLNYLRSNRSWVCDQEIMQDVFRREEYAPLLKTYTGDLHNYFNYDGPNIRQMLRAHNSNEERLDKARAVRDRFLGHHKKVTA